MLSLTTFSLPCSHYPLPPSHAPTIHSLPPMLPLSIPSHVSTIHSFPLMLPLSTPSLSCSHYPLRPSHARMYIIIKHIYILYKCVNMSILGMPRNEHTTVPHPYHFLSLRHTSCQSALRSHIVSKWVHSSYMIILCALTSVSMFQVNSAGWRRMKCGLSFLIHNQTLIM